jgi:hypothetical protein
MKRKVLTIIGCNSDKIDEGKVETIIIERGEYLSE